MNDIKYDIFISFKNSRDGVLTKDKNLAENLYNFLNGKGLKVFYSPVSLKEEGEAKFKEGIDRALDAADVLVAVGCSRDNFEAKWIQYECDYFLKNKPKNRLFVLYKDMPLSEVPEILSDKQQSFDAGKQNALEELFDWIKNKFDENKKKALIKTRADYFVERAKYKYLYGYNNLSKNDFLKARDLLSANSDEKLRLDDKINKINMDIPKTVESNIIKNEIISDNKKEGVLNDIIQGIGKGKSVRKFYLDHYSTILIPLGFIFLFMFVLLQRVSVFSLTNYNSTDIEGIIFWIFWIGLAGLFFVLAYFLKNSLILPKLSPSKSQIKHFVIDHLDNNQKEMLLSRTEQKEQIKKIFDKAFEENKYAFLVGKSGSGKSILVDEYLIDYPKSAKKFEARHYVDEGLFKDSIESLIGDKEDNQTRYIVIFDQFEKAFKNKGIYECITNFLFYLRKSNNTVIKVAFVCTMDMYSEIFEDIEFSINKNLDNENRIEFVAKFIKFSNEERPSIEKQLKSFLQEDERGNYFRNLLDDLSLGKASMLDLNIARRFFERQKDTAIISNLLKKSNSRELIWEEYFEQVFAKIDFPEYALIILYALCKYKDGLTINDFQNLTFAPREVLEGSSEYLGVLSVLLEQKIIEITDKNNFNSPYLMTHDRITEFLEAYCKGKLFRDIAQNIDFYCAEKEKDVKNNKTHNHLSVYYKQTIEKQASSKLIEKCMVGLYSLLFLSNIWLLIKGYGPKTIPILGWVYSWNLLLHLQTLLAVSLATYYVYHYLQYFAKIFFSRKKGTEFWVCVLLITWGPISISLALLFNGLWAAFIAIGWLLIGILHLHCVKKYPMKENTKDWIKGEGNLYVRISLILIAFNVFILGVGGQMVHETLLVWLGIPVFIAFTFDVIRRHVNREWMLAKIGVFVNMSMKDKEGKNV